MIGMTRRAFGGAVIGACALGGGAWTGRRVVAVGVGRAGSNFVERAGPLMPGVDAVAVDADAGRLAALPSASTRLVGADGDRTPEALASALGLSDAALVFVIAGLGGRTGTSLAPRVAAAARGAGARVVALLVLPFHFEGRRRRAVAHHGVTAVEPFVDDMETFQNDVLAGLMAGGASKREAFDRMDLALIQAIQTRSEA